LDEHFSRADVSINQGSVLRRPEVRCRTRRGVSLVWVLIILVCLAGAAHFTLPALRKVTSQSGNSVVIGELTALMSAESQWYQLSGEYAGGVTGGIRLDGGVSFVDGSVSSTGPGVISISTGGGQMAAAELSTTGACFTYSISGSPISSQPSTAIFGASQSEPCDADTAMAQLGHEW